MSDDPKELPKDLTQEEIRRLIEGLARNGEGADQRWALKILREESSKQDERDIPRTHAEIVDRLVRVMRPAGGDLVRVAYHRAFPRSISPDNADVVPLPEELSSDAKSRVLKATSMKALFKIYPALSRNGGRLPGYPAKDGIIEKRKWCQSQALKIEIDRARVRRDYVEQGPEGKDAATQDSG